MTIDFSNPHWDGHGKLYPGTIRVLMPVDRMQPFNGHNQHLHLMPLARRLQELRPAPEGYPYTVLSTHEDRSCPYVTQKAALVLNHLFGLYIMQERGRLAVKAMKDYLTGDGDEWD